QAVRKAPDARSASDNLNSRKQPGRCSAAITARQPPPASPLGLDPTVVSPTAKLENTPEAELFRGQTCLGGSIFDISPTGPGWTPRVKPQNAVARGGHFRQNTPFFKSS